MLLPQTFEKLKHKHARNNFMAKINFEHLEGKKELKLLDCFANDVHKNFR